MNEAENLDSSEPEVIRHQIEITKASISDKFESLENEVKDTVSEIRSEVRETVDAVKRSFDIRQHVKSYPWTCMGGGVCFGFILSKWLANSMPERLSQYRFPNDSGLGTKHINVSTNGRAQDHQTNKKEDGSLAKIARQLSPEITQLKGLALGILVTMLGELAKNSLPQSLSQKVGDVFESASSKLGMKPV